FFFFQAEDGIRDRNVTGVQTCALPISVILRQRVTGPPPAPERMRAHPGHEWLVVLSGTLTLLLGERRYRVTENQCAEFDTMLPHAFGAEGAPADVLLIVDPEARRGHQGDGVD